MEESNVDVPVDTGSSTIVIEETIIYDFTELLEELQLLREDFNTFNIKYDEVREQQEIFYFDNITQLQATNTKLNTMLDYTSFLLVSFLIFSGILIGYILGKKD